MDAALLTTLGGLASSLLVLARVLAKYGAALVAVFTRIESGQAAILSELGSINRRLEAVEDRLTSGATLPIHALNIRK